MAQAVDRRQVDEISPETGESAVRPEVLLVEDEPTIAQLYEEVLRQGGWEVQSVRTAEAARRALRQGPRVIVLDLNLPDADGLEILGEATRRARPSLVIVVTARGSIRTAVEAMRLGAYDFLVKPIAVERLLTTVRNAFDRSRLDAIVDGLRDSSRTEFEGLVGASPVMQAVYRMISMVAPSRAPVLLHGESGTGKELCAEAIHRLGRTPDGPFVVVNCGAIPQGLAESELFGHVKGAFTDAVSDRDGAVARADGGTLFLDEVGELPLDLQVKLLRFTQSMTFHAVGSDTVRSTSVRLICATNRNLIKEVDAGRFRDDLFYRISVLAIEIPPLRDRRDDIAQIARHYLRRYGEEEGKSFDGLTPEAEQVLRRQRWPGNVRQLQNVVRSAAVMNPGGMLDIDAVVSSLALTGVRRGEGDEGADGAEPAEPTAPTGGARPDPTRIRPLDEIEREAIEDAIAVCNGNIAEAARALGISVATIYRRRRRWEEPDSG